MYLLHPSVSWLRVSDNKLQVRAPDGARITFDKDADAIERILESLSVGVSSVPEGDSAQTTKEIIELLSPSGLVIEPQEKPDPDVFMDLIDFMARKRTKPTRARSPSSVARVTGTGLLADAVQQALAASVFPIGDGRDEPLNAVCSDVDDQVLCREQNRTFVDAKQSVTFIRLAPPWLFLGPYVVPGESACFECFVERKLNNMKFSEEAIAEVNEATGLAPRKRQPVSPALASLVQFAAVQHISGIRAGLLSIVEPGVIYGLNMLDLRSARQPVLKLPRCPVCGRARASQFERAIRDMSN